MLCTLFFYKSYGNHRALHSFPTRRSSDLVEDTDLVCFQKARHARRVAGARQRARDNDPVVAGEYASDLVAVAFKDRKSTRLNSSHGYISYAVFCLKKKK